MAGVEIKGGREFRSVLRRTEPAIDKELKVELGKIGARIALVGAAKAPKLSGDLQRSIRPYVTARGIGVGSNLPYAGVVHWGGTIAPRGTPITFERQPFLVRAADDVADWALHEVGNAFGRAARNAGWQ